MSFGMPLLSCLSPSLIFPLTCGGRLHVLAGRTLFPLTNQLKHKAAMSNYWRHKLKVQIAALKNLRVKFKCKTWKQCAWSILMKPLKGINTLGNCWISPFLSKAPFFLITSQLITKPRDVTNKKLFGFSRRWVDREIRKIWPSLLSIKREKTCLWYYNNRGNLWRVLEGRSCKFWARDNSLTTTQTQ